MRYLVLTLALAATPFIGAEAQQKVDIRRAAAPDVSVRLSGAFVSLRIIAWPVDSIVVTGAVGAGSRFEGGALSTDGPVKGMKFYVDGPMDPAVSSNRFELRVPRGARVWVKTGSADIEANGVSGGLDLNVIGGSIRVNGRPRELLVESMDGSVHFTGFADFARIKTATGNIVLEGGGEDLTLTTVSGTIQGANGKQPVQRARFETVTGPIVFSGDLTRGADLRFDSHSGAIELRLGRSSPVEVDIATMTGTIENTYSSMRPSPGREGRGMELNTSSGMGAARVEVKSFKGNVRLTAK
jgi:hypothetical protein